MIKTNEDLFELMRSISEKKAEYIRCHYRLGFDREYTVTAFVDCVLVDYHSEANERLIRHYIHDIRDAFVPLTYMHKHDKIYETLAKLKDLIVVLEENNQK